MKFEGLLFEGLALVFGVPGRLLVLDAGDTGGLLVTVMKTISINCVISRPIQCYKIYLFLHQCKIRILISYDANPNSSCLLEQSSPSAGFGSSALAETRLV